MEIDAPFDAYRDVVRPEWIDSNQHMNVGYYLVVFDLATDEFMRWIGLGQEYPPARPGPRSLLPARRRGGRADPRAGGFPPRPDARGARARRRAQPYPQRVLHADPGARARRGAARGKRGDTGRPTGSASRHPVLDQGPRAA